MSELTLTETEVLTGHTDVICSTSIERIVSGRNAALAEIEVLIRRLAAISEQAASIGGGTSNNWGQIASHRHGCWLVESEELAMKIITQNIDRSIWRNLMHQSGLGGSWVLTPSPGGTGNLRWKRFVPSAKRTSTVLLKRGGMTRKNDTGQKVCSR